MSDKIKFRYDISSGVLEYEGAYELLAATLKQLNDVMVAPSSKVPQRNNNRVSTESVTPKPKKNSGSYKSKFNPELDLLGLEPFYDSLELSNFSEHVVAFVVFLTEDLKLETITPNDVYSCFYQLRSKIKQPAFPKALENAKLKGGYIEYDKGYGNPRLTKTGFNHFHHTILKRKKEI